MFKIPNLNSFNTPQAFKYPWLGSAVMGTNTQPGGCAATLIAAQWAVTAAHCVTSGESISAIVLGEHHLFSASDANDGRR